MAQGNAGPGVRGTTTRKLTLLTLTLLPLGFMLVLYVWAFWAFMNDTLLINIDLDKNPLGVLILLPYLIFVLLTLGLMIWYIRDAARNAAFDTAIKIIWALAIMQFSILAMPLYWFFYIWREAVPRASVGVVSRDISPLEQA